VNRRAAQSGINRLARYFGWPADVWVNLQATYDRQMAEKHMHSALARIGPCTALAAATT